MNTSLTINSTKNLIMWYKVTYYNALREFDKLQFIFVYHTMRYGAVSVSAMLPCPLLFIIIPLPPNQNQ